jgi:leucine dehydrogenase
MKCNIVAGAANNQLSDESVDGLRLNDRGIVYAPDFLINAGGVINCYKEVKNLSDEETNVLIENIYGRTLEVLDRARERKSTPQITAIAMAKERIEKNKIG